jgi:hypothetical protein
MTIDLLLITTIGIKSALHRALSASTVVSDQLSLPLETNQAASMAYLLVSSGE